QTAPPCRRPAESRSATDDLRLGAEFLSQLLRLVVLAAATALFGLEHHLGDAVVRYLAGAADADELDAALGFTHARGLARLGLLDVLCPVGGQLRLQNAAEVADGDVDQALGEFARRGAVLEALAQCLGLALAHAHFAALLGRNDEAHLPPPGL